MDEVRWGPGSDRNSDRSTRPPGRVARWRADITGRASRRIPFDALADRISAGLVIVGFVLLLGSQYFPWVTYGYPQIVRDNEPTFPASGLHASIADAGALTLPYYACWLVALTLCGMCVFAGGRRRKQLFGAAAGSLATVIVVMLPVVHQPARLISNDLVAVGNASSLGDPHRNAGMAFAFAAVAVLAIAMIIAVRGQVLPYRRVEHDAAPMAHPGAGRAGAGHPGADPDIASGDAGPPATNAFTVAGQHAPAGDEMAEPAAPSPGDHSLYERPHTIDYSKR